jgi:hypothetical protein
LLAPVRQLAVGFLAGKLVEAIRVFIAAQHRCAPVGLVVLGGLVSVVLVLDWALPARELVSVRACFEKKVVNTRMSKQAGARIGRGRVSVSKRTEYAELF